MLNKNGLKMKHGTKIGWTHFPGYKGESWNPIVGCSHAGSPGCLNCYAEVMAKRLKAMRLEQYQIVVDDNGWTGKIDLASGRTGNCMTKPSHWKKPRAIFVCSMGDLFHENVPGRWINEVWMQVFNNPRHIFIILTKRPKRLLEWTKAKAACTYWPEGEIWPQNAIMGVTAENQEMADKRIPLLLQTPCAHRFVSVEPMLSPVHIGQAFRIWNEKRGDYSTEFMDKYLHWIICGSESGPNARPMEIEWARNLRDQCKAAEVPFFMKQITNDNGRPIPIEEWPEDLRIQEFPEVIGL